MTTFALRSSALPVDFHMRSRCPTTNSMVVHVASELDSLTTPLLHELLAPRLASRGETVVLDLSELRFLGVTGLEFLAHAHHVGRARGTEIRIVGGPVCVDRALRAAGWLEVVPIYPTVAAALAELNGKTSECLVHAAS